MESFGRHLRGLRVRAGLKLKDLAEKMNWSSVYVSDIEMGRRNPPSPEKINQIASALGIDPKELLDLADKEMKKVVLDLDHESPKRTEMALMLARSWDGLTEEELEEMQREVKRILDRRAHEKNE